ncbi:hypothetical protein MNBD_ACTINO02-3239 [hydrothermal vent metagenome]|uniref:4Fe-4S Wbl-type domain-containing protein n=1 Tax=hydrothermal vent metagenome TaxID=652676 RepID=A0A3B0SJW6_9ZZZZ
MVMALTDPAFEPIETWRHMASCNGADLDLFFPAGEDDSLTGPALRVCAECPVQQECLDYAVETNQTEGVWGGMTGPDRRRLRRRIRDRERRERAS